MQEIWTIPDIGRTGRSGCYPPMWTMQRREHWLDTQTFRGTANLMQISLCLFKQPRMESSAIITEQLRCFSDLRRHLTSATRNLQKWVDPDSFRALAENDHSLKAPATGGLQIAKLNVWYKQGMVCKDFHFPVSVHQLTMISPKTMFLIHPPPVCVCRKNLLTVPSSQTSRSSGI